MEAARRCEDVLIGVLYNSQNEKPSLLFDGDQFFDFFFDHQESGNFPLILGDIKFFDTPFGFASPDMSQALTNLVSRACMDFEFGVFFTKYHFNKNEGIYRGVLKRIPDALGFEYLGNEFYKRFGEDASN